MNRRASASLLRLPRAPCHRRTATSTVRQASRLVAWGWGHHGQLGIAGVPLSHTKSGYFPAPVQMPEGDEQVVDLGCGHFHAFARTAKGNVYGWGMNEHHQLFGEHNDNVDTPRLLNPMLPFLAHEPPPQVKKMAGSGVTSALLVAHHDRTELWTWGSSMYALAHAPQFPKKKAASAPSKVVGLEGEEIIDFGLGWGHGLALTASKKLFVWGWGKNGQLGLGNYDNQPVPAQVTALSGVPIRSLAVGPDCSAVVSEEGQVYFWGRNEYWMQIKVAWTKGGETMGECAPIHIAFPDKAPRMRQVRCGYGHLVAVDEEGQAWAWGLNKNGQLGLGDKEEHQEPRPVAFFREENLKVAYVSCGRVHTVFLTDDGRLWTCGSGVYGRLGHGDKEDQIVPTLVESLADSRVTQVECGYDFNLALLHV